jgi:hypothetical protein
VKRRRTRRWIGAGLAVVVVVIAVFALTQAGGGGGGSLNAIAKAAEVTQREPGGRAIATVKVTSSATPEPITENDVLTFDDRGRSQGNETVKVAGKEVTMLAVAEGTKSWVSSDSLAPLLEGKKWMELDFSSVRTESGAAPSTNVGPEEGLKTLEGVQDAKKIGEEDIRGVPTTHYRGTVPATAEAFGVKTNFSAPKVDVWIDAQGRVRRLRATVSGSLGKSEDTTTTEMTIDYVEFGHVPKIELPNPDEVFDATSEFESKVQSAAGGH